MIETELIRPLLFSAPIVCALACMTMMLIDSVRPGISAPDKRLRLFMAAAYLTGALCWMGLAIYLTDQKLFVWYQSLFLLTLTLDQVLIYRFVYIITSTGERGTFSSLHFGIPLVLVAVSVFSALSVPMEQQVSVIFYGDRETANWWYRTFYASTSVFFILYNTLYPVLGLVRMRDYRRRIVDYSADTQRISLGWLPVMLALTLITVPVPLAGLLLNINTFTSIWFAWLGAFPAFAVYLIICYNLLSDNYLIISPDTKEEAMPLQKANIDRRKFERYIREKKPYLNPKLRITMISAGLNTNRSYVSALINKEYGMNFCRYINRCRLEEIDRLRSSAGHKQHSNIEIVLMAGFSNYRSYLRAKNDDYESGILKAFE